MATRLSSWLRTILLTSCRMETLKLVKQLDEYGCTIACMSMITGIPYFEMRARLHLKCPSIMRDGTTNHRLIGLSCTQEQEILENVFRIPCRFIKFLSLNELKKHCILSICGLKGRGGHSVIFDAKSRCILDPNGSLSGGIKDLSECNVTCCIEIQ